MIYRRLLNSLANRLRYLKLHTKLIAIFVLSVFIPLFAATTLFVSHAIGVSENITITSINNSFDQAYSILANQFNSIRTSSLLVLNDDNIVQYIRQPPQPYSFFELNQIKQAINNNLYYVESTLNFLKVRIYVNQDYANLIDYNNYFHIDNLSETPWYRPFKDSPYRNAWLSAMDNTLDKTPFLSQADPNKLSYVVKAVNMEDYRELSAILKFDFSLDKIDEILKKSLAVEGGTTFLLSNEGSIIAVAGNPLANGATSLKQFPSLLAPHGMIKIDGISCYYCCSSFDKQPWTLVTLIPYRYINTFSRNNQIVIYILTAFAVGLLIFFTTLVFSRSITSRISTIAKSMKDIKTGELKMISQSRSQDEIGSLIDDYNYMACEMKLLIESRYVDGLNLKSAELKALLAQINPHFLYNTLELINCYAFENEPQVVERLISALSKFYKLSLNQGKDICQVWQEIQLVESYFAIQDIRYPDSLKLSINIPASMMQYNIPKITLQPLIENSILHGILNQKPKRGTIIVDGSVADGVMKIRIMDDGVGMDAQALARLNQNPLHDLNPHQPKSSTHYGIKNINERFQMYYGPEYHLVFTSQPGQGTTVQVTLPAE